MTSETALEAGSAAGLGLATVTPAGKVLDTWYPHTTLVADEVAALRAAADADGTVALSGLDLPDGAAAVAAALLEAEAANAAVALGNRARAVLTTIGSLADAPTDAHDVYLRLHLLSNRSIRPHGASLDGAFGLLQNVVWTDLGPCDPDVFEDLRLQLRATGTRVQVIGVDKFPRMTDYVVPSGVRIADADRVRLGAHLSEGTTVMHEGFCNFNAGTLGAAMVEGRISAGVVVGDHSDIGGGASVMGTLSGGGKEVIRIGEGCLLGANAGIGISLGDDCIVEAGLYVTAGTKVQLPDGSVGKAAQVSGQDGLLFRRNSITGAVEVSEREGRSWGGLNADLHTNA